MIAECNGDACLSTRPDQVAGTARGPLGVVFQFQGTEPLRGSVDLLGAFGTLGLRVMQLTYNYRTLAGDGCCEPADSGLSTYGTRLVEAAVTHGISLDVSHASQRTSLDIIDKARSPVIVTLAILLSSPDRRTSVLAGISRMNLTTTTNSMVTISGTIRGLRGHG